MNRILAKKFFNRVLIFNRNYSTKGSDIIYQKLLEHNVKNTWIYSGGSVMPIIDKFYNGDINYYVNSHEQNCGHAATGYAKSSGKTGVCIVTSGPGITNMITPMLDATNDSTPLIVISGQVAKTAIGTDAFQEAPAVEISKSVTKWSYCVKDVSELPEVMDKAFLIANDKKKGSVHIDIPKCVSNDDYFHSDSEIESPKISVLPEIDNNHVNKIVDMINNSKKPILYVGQGCVEAYQELREFAINGNIPVTTTIHGNGIFDESHPLSLRWCGMHGNPAANYSLQEADCIIALGSRFDDRTTGLISDYAPKARQASEDGTGGIIHVDIEPRQIDKVIKSDLFINGKCLDFLRLANPLIKYNSRKDWINFINKKQNEHPFDYNKKETKLLKMEEVLIELNDKTKNKDVVFTTGVGNHQMQCYQFIKSQYPKKIISSGSLGVMGVGLPYSIGVQIANPDKLVVNFDGDSSFNMTLSDLKTVKEHNLPIKIAIMNNSAQMMVTIWEKLFFEERYTATINKSNPDYTKLAESYGIQGIKCSHISDLKKTIDYFINYDGPILCEFEIEKNICLPLVGPGKALDDMILFNDYKNENKINLSGDAPS